jgi:glycosyltransferase involved in cell wall biosynthesis
MTMPGRAIRVLYLVDELRSLGGTETNLVRLLPRLPRERIDPYLVTYDLNREEPAFERLGCPLEVYPLRRIYTWAAVRLGWRLRKLIRLHRFDIVHCFFESSDLWGAPIARWAGVPVIVSSRRDLGIHRNLPQDLGYRLVSPLFDQVQAVSEEVRQWVIRHDRLAAERVVTIANGIDLEEMRAKATPAEVRRRYGLPDDAALVTVVGNIRRVKGQDVFLEAAQLVGSSRRVAFVLAGKVLEPVFHARLQELANTPPLRGRVHFLGAVGDVPSLLAASDVFVLPSRSEGMSTALLEALACGRPVIATAVGGSPEVVRQDETGLLVPAENPALLASSLEMLLDSPAQCGRLGQAGRRLIETAYSLDTVVTRMVEEYEKLVFGVTAAPGEALGKRVS